MYVQWTVNDNDPNTIITNISKVLSMPSRLKKVINAFISILLDQLNHSLFKKESKETN